MDQIIGVGILGGQPILLGICGQDSPVPFIPGRRDPTVAYRNRRIQENCGAVEGERPNIVIVASRRLRPHTTEREPATR